MKYKVRTKVKEEIAPEEILLDSEKKKKEEKKGRLEVLIKDGTFSFILILLIFFLFGFFFKTFYLVAAEGERLSQEAKANYQRVSCIEAPRGEIYSSDETKLVENTEEQKEKEDEAGNKMLNKRFSRSYLESDYFSHILGYINEVLSKEIEKDSYYISGDRIGREGIEKSYEKFLRGEKGKIEKVVNAEGKFIAFENITEPIKGNNLVLNINAGLQKKLHDVIKEKVPDKNAVAIALNPQDGKVLAMVSFPSYDNNLISEKYSEYIKDSQNPLLNRVIAGLYSSGSIIKPLIALAGLQEGVITSKTKLNCIGKVIIPNPWDPSNPTIKKDWKTHGIVDLKKAIAESCNVFFYATGGGYGDIKGLGIEKMKEYLDLFYMEDKLELDIPGEKVGFVPTLEWFDETQKGSAKRNWSIGDVYDVSIGQGYFTAPPLHLITALSLIANGGKIYQPQIVDKVLDNDGNTISDIMPKVLKEDLIEKEYIELVREGMRECVLTGSCRQLQDLPVACAGKTGTAETEGDKEPHAWFVTFAPYENPEIILLVMVEYGGSGSKIAAPIAKEVFEWYFR